MARPRIPLSERFARHVRKTKTCWIWLGHRNHDGYGTIAKGGRNAGFYLAHRAAWTLHFGPIPEGLLILHSCDNPACVNPKHLRPGTAAQNNLEMAERGRHALGERTRRNKLTALQVAVIRRLLESGLLNHVQIARAFKVRRETVWEIAHRKTWKGYVQCNTTEAPRR